MANTKNKIKLSTIILLALCLVGIGYSLWYLITGWTSQNAIMAFCSKLNDTELGWFKYVCGHGALNFSLGYIAIFFALSPILVFVLWLLKRRDINVALDTLFAILIITIVIVAVTVIIIYSGLYMMEAHPIISGLLIVVGALVALSSGYTVVQVYIIEK